jgi:hypothetical protein
MAELAALRDLSADERQLLKEAVCDAVLSRTHAVVSGHGEFGRTILGNRPSRTLASGFILPRINDDGDDESSDIHICAHGMDLRLRHATGALNLAVDLFVYVRALPSADELFARSGRMIPPADFNDQARQQIRATLRARSSQEIAPRTAAPQRALQRAQITRDIYLSLGVSIPEQATLPGGDDRDITGDQSDLPPSPIGAGRLQIPDRHSRRYSIPEKWVRLPVAVPNLELPLPCDPANWQQVAQDHKSVLIAAISAAYRAWIASDQGALWAWRKLNPPSESFWTPEAWENFLGLARQTPPNPAHLVPQFDAHILVQPLPDPRAPGEYSLRIAIENLREDDSDKECGLFGVRLSLTAPREAIGPMRLERIKRSYHLAGFMTMPGIGVNGGIEQLADDPISLRTTWMPRYVLPRQRASVIPDLDASFTALSADAFDPESLRPLPAAMLDWINEIANNTVLGFPDEEGTPADEAAQAARFADDLDAWRRETQRIEHGIDLLKRAYNAAREGDVGLTSAPYRAWRLLNETFAAANPHVAGDEAPSWRLFQLGFILAHVPTLASRLAPHEGAFRADFDEDSVSLLYMATGGGKTEAFFGTIIYALFLDRLRGKKRGVTAMMHYPLRLLTVQQAQRLARLLAQAELVRRSAELGGSAFEIGFWVGGTNTPNATEKRAGTVVDELTPIPAWNARNAGDEAALLRNKEYAACKEAWAKLPICPFCHSSHGVGLRLYPERHNRLAIVCLNPACAWNALHATLEPLPFLLADTDIYRRAPSILLGTIDKLALLGQSTTTIDRIAGMFGLARWVEGGEDGLLHMPSGAAVGQRPDPYACVAPAFADGEEIFVDPFPSLIVQDEMHLLEESLGTFGGIFETGLFSWLEELARLLGPRVCRAPGAPDRPRMPHVIGATATAADVAKHARALYQKQVVQFPHPGPSLHAGFYTRMAAFSSETTSASDRTNIHNPPRAQERAAPWGRVYASLMTNGRLHTVTTLSILAVQAATITRWQRDLSAHDSDRQARAASEIEASLSDQPFAEGRREVVHSVAASGRYDRLAALVDLHRIQLIYVTNKKGGDQILSALLPEALETHLAMGDDYALRNFATELISGGVDIGAIQRVIRVANQTFDPMTGNINDALRGIVATAAISHGVDVETFNAMIFAGMPSDIAEYIQASSRVGRTHVGFSLLVPTPQTRRDRFIVEVHDSFHRLLERMIASPAIERWADRAIDRTVPSLVQTWIAGVRHQQRFVAAGSADKARITLPTSVESMEHLMRDTAFDDCVAFVQRAVGVPASVGGPTNPDYYASLVRAAVLKIRSTLAGGDFTGPLRDFWGNRLTNLQRPMTSLRDVDAAGKIRASHRTNRNRHLDPDDVAEAMAVLRTRGGGRRRRTAASELDGEG